jgi:hypothetical protein
MWRRVGAIRSRQRFHTSGKILITTAPIADLLNDTFKVTITCPYPTSQYSRQKNTAQHVKVLVSTRCIDTPVKEHLNHIAPFSRSPSPTVTFDDGCFKFLMTYFENAICYLKEHSLIRTAPILSGCGSLISRPTIQMCARYFIHYIVGTSLQSHPEVQLFQRK